MNPYETAGLTVSKLLRYLKTKNSSVAQFERDRALSGVLTFSHGGDLFLGGQHDFGFSGQVLAAALLVPQGYGDAPRQVVHAVDDGRVSVCLKWQTMKIVSPNILHVQVKSFQTHKWNKKLINT